MYGGQGIYYFATLHYPFHHVLIEEKVEQFDRGIFTCNKQNHFRQPKYFNSTVAAILIETGAKLSVTCANLMEVDIAQAVLCRVNLCYLVDGID